MVGMRVRVHFKYILQRARARERERETSAENFLRAAFCRHETFFAPFPFFCGPRAGWVFWVYSRTLLIYYHFTQRRLWCLHVHRVRFIFTNAPSASVCVCESWRRFRPHRQFATPRALLTPFLGGEFFTHDERGLIKISVHWKQQYGFRCLMLGCWLSRGRTFQFLCAKSFLAPAKSTRARLQKYFSPWQKSVFSPCSFLSRLYV